MAGSKKKSPEDILDATLRAADVLLRVVARSVIAVEDEITGPQLRVLLLILRGGPTTPGAVAAELNVHASNATRICRRLESAGYVARASATSDLRLRRYDLTSSGRSLVEGVIEQRRSAVERVIDRLDPAVASDLRVTLDAFAAAAQGENHGDAGFTISGAAVSDISGSPLPRT